jgi:polyisoprenoid-binding protein YceI
MKTKVSSLLILAVMAFGVISCGGDKKSTETKEAEEVKAPAEAAVSYRVNTEESIIDWKGKKPGTTHTGTLKVAKGIVSMAGESLEGGEFVFDMSTIVVTDLEGKQKDNLEAHLKGTVEGKEGDFFNINKYPMGNFAVTGIEEKDGKTYLSGNLTLKEITRNVSFPVTIQTEGDKVMITSDEFAIDRTEWEINFGSKSIFDNLGDNFIHDDILLTINVEAVKA